jgi:hypothetical protein
MASPEVDPKSERKKMFAALALGLVALIALWYAFFGSSSSKPAVTPGKQPSGGGATLAPRSPSGAGDGSASLVPATMKEDASPLPPSPIPLEDTPPPGIPEAGRNIFAYYVPPPKPVVTPTPAPPPSPTPPPPLTLSSVSPTNVFARTSDFKLDVMGDKFTPQTRIYVDGRELETRYISQQQLSATVPASVIAYEGARQIVVRTPDGTLYSNTASVNVAAPPVPNYTYVGLIGGPRYNDTAILKDKNSKNLVNVQRGDTLGGRFRVTSISQREVVVVDTNLRVKHTLPLTTEGGNQGGNPQQRVPQQPSVIEGQDSEEP